MNNLEIATSVLKAWEDRDAAKAAALLADDFALTGPSPDALPKPAYLEFQRVHNVAFPDWQFNIRETQAEGDTVRMTFQISASHTGMLDVSTLGLPVPPLAPTGKSRSWPVEHITFTMKDGKVIRAYVENEPEGGLIGTLAWLGVKVAAPAL